MPTVDVQAVENQVADVQVVENQVVDIAVKPDVVVVGNGDFGGEIDPKRIPNMYYEEDGVVHKIDKKFLPDDIGGNGDPGGPIDPTRIPDMYYTEDGEMVEILPETEGIFVEDMGGFGFMGTPLSLVEGTPYTVKYNGADFECVATKMEMGEDVAIGLGDTGALAGEPTGSFPFLVVVADMLTSMGVACGAIPLDGSTSVTVSILGKGETIHHIPPKYIKDMYYEEVIEEKEILPETVLPQKNYSMEGVFLQLKNGYPYTVIYDGTSYNCVGKTVDVLGFSLTFVGNSGSFDGKDTGEPFCIFAASNTTSFSNTKENVTIRIIESGAVIHEMPAKFLPEISPEKLPLIPVEKLPKIPGEQLSDVPIEKLPSRYNIYLKNEVDTPVFEAGSCIFELATESPRNYADISYRDGGVVYDWIRTCFMKQHLEVNNVRVGDVYDYMAYPTVKFTTFATYADGQYPWKIATALVPYGDSVIMLCIGFVEEETSFSRPKLVTFTYKKLT